MEVIGRSKLSVTSLSACATSPTSFASLESNGDVTMWDLRLPRKSYVHIESSTNHGKEATELLLVSNMNLAVVLAKETVTTYDLRKCTALHHFSHSSELDVFLSGNHMPSETSTLLVDDNGAIIPFDLRECAPTTQLCDRYFGSPVALPSPSFGSLSNICCGLGVLGERRLCAVGMNGIGAIYTDPLRPSTPFVVGECIAKHTGSAMVNPPLPSVCGFFEKYMAVGRADGMYCILTEDDTDGVFEVLAAPGHAVNGLCVASWTRDGRLVTCSLCGEVSAWEVMPMLLEEPSTDEDEVITDAPPLLTAFSIREATGMKQATMNCGTLLNNNALITADTMGFVTLCSLA